MKTFSTIAEQNVACVRELQVIDRYGSGWLAMYRALIEGGDAHSEAMATIAGEKQMAQLTRKEA